MDFIVIGGHAVAAHGYARATRDVDIVFSRDERSCAKLAAALSELGASILVADLPAPGGEITSSWLRNGGQFIFQTKHGTLDAFTWISGNSYESLEEGAVAIELGDGTALQVCGYDDLLAMKERAQRPKDEEDLRNLRSLDDQR